MQTRSLARPRIFSHDPARHATRGRLSRISLDVERRAHRAEDYADMAKAPSFRRPFSRNSLQLSIVRGGHEDSSISPYTVHTMTIQYLGPLHEEKDE